MAVYIDFNVSESDNAKELSFIETTGAYDPVSNTGGWGAPNEATTDATLVQLKITPPDGTEVILDITPDYPTTDRSITKTIRSQDLVTGIDDDILPDGLWLFKYEVTTPIQGLIINCQTILISGNARCCVYGLLADIDLCDCDGSERARALEAFTYYRAAIACAASGNTEKFTELLKLIKTYCESSSCVTC